MRVGAGLSRTPEPGVAAVEAADAAAQALAGAPVDLAVVFAGPSHTDDLVDVGLGVATRLDPGCLIGAVAQGVVGPAAEVEQGPAVSVWCASFGGGEARPFRAWAARPQDGGVVVMGWPDSRPGDVTLVLADPFTFPVADVTARLGRERPGQPVVGGMVTGGPHRSRLLLDGDLHEDGAVGVVLSDVDVDAVVSQGCRPVGPPLTVTGAEHNLITSLAGEDATVVLQRIFDEAGDTDRRLLASGLQIGLVVDEYRDEFSTGDFLIRAVLGADGSRRALAIGDVVRPGQTVQFQVRDPASASDDLVAAIADGRGPAAGTLLFTCNGRGQRFFGAPDRDVTTVERELGGAVAGAFCAGEIGPVGDHSFVHGFTASLAVFRRDVEA
ncbi:MAG: FIST C-terminal domain-containing protein [Actinobacteria bacterium]|nr:FIST C-terminal domain-containing protein [Actinomycetota bacterium]